MHEDSKIGVGHSTQLGTYRAVCACGCGFIGPWRFFVDEAKGDTPATVEDRQPAAEQRRREQARRDLLGLFVTAL